MGGEVTRRKRKHVALATELFLFLAGARDRDELPRSAKGSLGVQHRGHYIMSHTIYYSGSNTVLQHAITECLEQSGTKDTTATGHRKHDK